MSAMKQSISITLDLDVLAKIKDIAEYEGRSISQCINFMLKANITNREKKYNGLLFPNQE